jgi:hypothetical protein
VPKRDELNKAALAVSWRWRVIRADKGGLLHENPRCRSVAFIGFIACQLAAGHDRRQKSENGNVVDAGGNLRVPGDYRTAYQFLGSWAVAADQGQGSKEIHVVYGSPDVSAAYRDERQ